MYESRGRLNQTGLPLLSREGGCPGPHHISAPGGSQEVDGLPAPAAPVHQLQRAQAARDEGARGLLCVSP